MEEVIWDLLDQANIPFRSSLDELAEHMRPQREYAAGTEEYHFSGGPFIDNLSMGWRTTVAGPRFCPIRDIWSERRGAGWRANFEELCKGPQALWGAGKTRNASNAQSFEWSFGFASLSVTVWPPELNRWQNARHDALPDTVGAARMTIITGWRRSLSESEIRQLTAPNSVLRLPDRFPVFDLGCYERMPFDGMPDDGLWQSRDGALLLYIRRGRPSLIEHDFIIGVEACHMTPAKGGGGTGILLRLKGEMPDMDLCGMAYSVENVELCDQNSKRLADQLNVPFSRFEMADA